MPAPEPRLAPARERLLAAASTEFYAKGITATGVDTIVSSAGVAKMSLYNNFSSKDELVTAYLEERHEEWLALFRERHARAETPAARVLAVFDAYADHANSAYPDGWRGCGLLNAAAEFPSGHPGRVAVRRHKDEVEAILTRELGAFTDDPAPLAAHLALLLEGSMAKSGLAGNDAWVMTARALAASLLPGDPTQPGSAV